MKDPTLRKSKDLTIYNKIDGLLGLLPIGFEMELRTILYGIGVEGSMIDPCNVRLKLIFIDFHFIGLLQIFKPTCEVLCHILLT